jgi:hypothetical protein
VTSKALLVGPGRPPAPPRRDPRGRRSPCFSACVGLVAWAFSARSLPRRRADRSLRPMWNAGAAHRRRRRILGTSEPAVRHSRPARASCARADEYRIRWTAARVATCDRAISRGRGLASTASSTASTACWPSYIATPDACPGPARALDAAAHLDPPARCREPSAGRPNRLRPRSSVARARPRRAVRSPSGDFEAAAARRRSSATRQPPDSPAHPRVLWLARLARRRDGAGPPLGQRCWRRACMPQPARATTTPSSRAATYRLKSLVLDLGVAGRGRRARALDRDHRRPVGPRHRLRPVVSRRVRRGSRLPPRRHRRIPRSRRAARPRPPAARGGRRPQSPQSRQVPPQPRGQPSLRRRRLRRGPCPLPRSAADPPRTARRDSPRHAGDRFRHGPSRV